MAYTIHYERDEAGWWVARARGIRGCHTQGRSIRQARNRIREALALFVDDAEAAELIDDVRLPVAARKVVTEQQRARRAAERLRRASLEKTAHAARILNGRIGLSVRDVAEVLGLSHQRIQQLISD